MTPTQLAIRALALRIWTDEEETQMVSNFWDELPELLKTVDREEITKLYFGEVPDKWMTDANGTSWSSEHADLCSEIVSGLYQLMDIEEHNKAQDKLIEETLKHLPSFEKAILEAHGRKPQSQHQAMQYLQEALEKDKDVWAFLEPKGGRMSRQFLLLCVFLEPEGLELSPEEFAKTLKESFDYTKQKYEKELAGETEAKKDSAPPDTDVN